MRYSLGDSLSNYGFSFLEKLHTPIFLLHEKSGTLKKINEAGRKFLSVARIPRQQLEEVIGRFTSAGVSPQKVEHFHSLSGRKKIKVILKRLESSEYVLVELLR